jgi:hypothetical protein
MQYLLQIMYGILRLFTRKGVASHGLHLKGIPHVLPVYESTVFFASSPGSVICEAFRDRRMPLTLSYSEHMFRIESGVRSLKMSRS